MNKRASLVAGCRLSDQQVINGEESSVPMYVADPRFWNYIGDRRKAFILESLRSLQEDLRNEGSDLVFRTGRTEDVLENLKDEYDVEEVVYSRGYTPHGREIQEAIESTSLDSSSVRGNLVVEPDKFSREYSTFSQFYDEWKQKEKQAPTGKPENLYDIDAERVPKPEDIAIEVKFEMPEASEEAALERWRRFIDEKLETYRRDRDKVADPEAVSRMSAYISNGHVSVRRLLADVEAVIEGSEDSQLIKNAAKYRSELAWREFFYHVMWHNPSSVTENYRSFENEIEWRNDDQEFGAWKRGETGVPFVDAGMRQMLEEGYMHNRTRQNVASFLTKHLMVDWRRGERFFREKLVDHDTANNVGGWQWAASTGTDSVPVRIFNPVKQGRKYDGDAAYIRRHVPELEPLDPERIHSWVEYGERKRNELRNRHDIDYPSPVVDFDSRYQEGKKMFERALGR